MLKKTKLLCPLFFSLLCFTSITLQAQEAKAQNDVNYENPEYFNEYKKEKFFLHTNKTLFFPGEKVWWQAYVVSDFNDTRRLETTNLHVSLYDTNKALIQQDLFLCKNGIASGDITLPKSIETGTYYLKLDTQWNKNFNQEYIREIEVVDITKTPQQEEEVTKQAFSPNALEIDFHPESGTILNGINNTLNFVIKNNGNTLNKPLPVYITDNTSGKNIARTTSNSFGLGAVNFVFQPKHTYTAKLNYKGKDYVFNLPEASSSGLIIQKNTTSNKDNLDFKMHLSKDLVAKYHKETLYAIIHRNNKVRYVLPVNINKSFSKYILPLTTKELFNGVNTITVFNKKNQPVSERHFYIKTKQDVALEINHRNLEGDSLELNIRLPKSIDPASLSLSVLPAENKLNEKAESINTAFLLKPYLKTTPLTNLDELNDNTLDLITQIYSGKTKRNQFEHSKPIYNPELGFKISGSVNARLNKDKTYRVLLTSNENEVLEVADFNPEDKIFEFNNLTMHKGTKYSLALIDNKGELQKASFFVYDTHLSYKAENTLLYGTKKTTQNIENENSFTAAYNTQKSIFLKDAVELETVELYGKESKTKEIIDAYAGPPASLGSGFTKTLDISETDALNLKVSEFLQRQAGIQVYDYPELFEVAIGRSINSTILGSNVAMLVFNGIICEMDVLQNMRMNEIEEIKINHSGAGYGFRGTGGVIEVTTKKGGTNPDSITPPMYQESTLDLGFNTSEENFTAYPLTYANLESQKYYEALDWKTNINILPNRTATFKVYKGDHKNLRLIINGINAKSSFIHKEEKINLVDSL